MSAESMTTSEVRALLGLGSLAAARVWLRRSGIEATGRTLDGEKAWPAAAVKERAANRPGRGARTDLRSRLTENEIASRKETAMAEYPAAEVGRVIENALKEQRRRPRRTRQQAAADRLVDAIAELLDSGDVDPGDRVAFEAARAAVEKYRPAA